MAEKYRVIKEFYRVLAKISLVTDQSSVELENSAYLLLLRLRVETSAMYLRGWIEVNLVFGREI